MDSLKLNMAAVDQVMQYVMLNNEMLYAGFRWLMTLCADIPPDEWSFDQSQ